MVFPLTLGILGCAVLIGLGIWQVQRLAWKEGVLAEISQRIAGPVGPLPPEGAMSADPDAFRYRPVEIAGRTTGEEALAISGRKGEGPGFRVIAAFETAEGRRILLDRGFLPDAQRDAPRPAVALSLRGNLHWPRETDSYTPEPDRAANIWFARDVPSMAAALGTEELMVVAAEAGGDAQGIDPEPLDTSGIPNDHLEYAITWFLLAAVWAGMTVYLLWRIRRRTI